VTYFALTIIRIIKLIRVKTLRSSS